MATFKKGVFVDFVGMNTLISDPISASINTIGFAPQLNGQDQPRNIPPEDLVIPSGDLAGGLSGLLPSQGGHIKRYLNISVAHLPKSTTVGPFGFDMSITVPHEIPDILVSLNLHRNGPYGHCTWKQIRTADNPVSRFHNRNSNLTFVTQPGQLIDVSPSGSGTKLILERYSKLYNFKEPAVVRNSYPLVWNVGRHFKQGSTQELDRFSVLTSFGNNLNAFANDEVNTLHNIVMDHKDSEYNLIKTFYLNGNLEEPDSPFTHWEFLKYRETVYPLSKNMYRNAIRSRPEFKSFFRVNRPDRLSDHDRYPQRHSFGQGDGFGRHSVWWMREGGLFATSPSAGAEARLVASSWPLDASENFLTRTGSLNPRVAASSSAQGAQDDFGFGMARSASSLQPEDGFGDYRRFPFLGQSARDPGEATSGYTVVYTKNRGGINYKAPGVLQNNYCQLYSMVHTTLFKDCDFSEKHPTGHVEPFKANGISIADSTHGCAPQYAFRHTYHNTQSVSNPSGMEIPETGSGGPATKSYLQSDFGQGEALWEAHIQAGKTPFYDSYAAFAENIRLKGQSYSVLPEFRMSEHVADIMNTGSIYFSQELFEITGGVKGNNRSSHENFYKTYSNSDFMKHFDIIENDHDDFADSKVLTLRCRAIKKLLPYDGFYPCQRTVQLSEQFARSYFRNIKPLTFFGEQLGLRQGELPRGLPDIQLDGAKQGLFGTLFAPGVLFNSIKSGIAVDFPYITASVNHSGAVGGHFEDAMQLPYEDDFSGGTGAFSGADRIPRTNVITEDFTGRVPFEALLEPEAYLTNVPIANLEVHASGNITASAIWNGAGDEIYKMMAHNFMAEIPEFFLKDQNFTNISSLPQGNPNFGNVRKGAVYGMRIKMYRSMTGSATNVTGAVGTIYEVPQDIANNSYRETFTMYSRPSAFGPNSLGETELLGKNLRRIGAVQLNFYNPESTRMHTFRVDRGTGQAAGRQYMWKDYRYGYNFPYTPPYYHGQAWLDIYYTGSVDGKVSLEEILQFAQVSSSYTRFDSTFYLNNMDYHLTASAGFFEVAGHTKARGSLDLWTTTGPQAWGQNRINRNAVQLSGSINPFGKGALKSIDLLDDETAQEVNVVVNTATEEENRWIIQTKFETPMLNFNHISAKNGNLTLPIVGSASAARGMWHQYGKIPEVNEGVFLQVGPIPDTWREATFQGIGQTAEPLPSRPDVGDLAEVCGFSKEPVKLGRTADSKIISEAVVAIPFTVEQGTKKFFKLDPDSVRKYLKNPEESKIGLSVKMQIKRMEKYILPPSFDFVHNETVEPIAMYIFEFTHRLDQQDLADIWQNLPPKIGRTLEEATVQITHPLLFKELLGGGHDGNNTPHEYPKELRWMVFKAKKRAASNYFQKVISRNAAGISETGGRRLGKVTVDEFGSTTDVQFNWPYDYFSLVELASIDAEIEWVNADFSDFEEIMPKVNSIAASEAGIEYTNRELVDILEPPPAATVPEHEPVLVAGMIRPTPGTPATLLTGMGPFAFFRERFLVNVMNMGSYTEVNANLQKGYAIEEMEANYREWEITPSVLNEIEAYYQSWVDNAGFLEVPTEPTAGPTCDEVKAYAKSMYRRECDEFKWGCCPGGGSRACAINAIAARRRAKTSAVNRWVGTDEKDIRDCFFLWNPGQWNVG